MPAPPPDFAKPSPPSPEDVGAVEITVADGYSAFDLHAQRQVGPGETAWVHPKALARHPTMDATPPRRAVAGKGHPTKAEADKAETAKREAEAKAKAEADGQFGPDLTKGKPK